MAAKLDIEYVELKNFLSYGDYVTRLLVKDAKGGLGPVLVLGENDENDLGSSNGAGKSSLLTAFIWCLFGRTFTNPNPGDKVMNWHVGSDCYVKIKTTDGWEIIRTRNIDGHAELILKKDGNISETHSTSSNTQKELNRIFGLDYEIFTSSVFCGQFSKSFLEMSPIKRKEALERILGLHKLNDFAESAKKEFKNVEVEQNTIRSGIDLLKADTKRQEDRLVENEEKEGTFELEKKIKVDKIVEEINAVSSTIDNIVLPNIDILVHRWETIKAINAKLDEYKTTIRTNKADIAWNEKTIARMSDELRDLENAETPDFEALKLEYVEYTKKAEHKKLVGDAISNSTMIKTECKKEIRALTDKIEEWNKKALAKCATCDQVVDGKHAQKHVDIIDTKLSCVIEKKQEEDEKSKILYEEWQAIGDIPYPGCNLHQIENLEKHYKTDKNTSLLENDIKGYKQHIKDLEAENDKCGNVVTRVEKQLSDATPSMTIEAANAIIMNSDALARELERLMSSKSELLLMENPYTDICISFKNVISKLKAEMSSDELTINQLDILFAHYNYIYRSYSDRRKIKKWLLSELIPFLNDRICYYLDSFDLDMNISFTSTLSSETDKWGYEFCSGGERKRIDLSIMFALYDLYMSIYGQQCNVMILDEVDGRLDAKGVEAFSDIINDFNTDNSTRPCPDTILVISHKNELKDVFPSQITVKKKGNFSVIEQ